MMLVLGSFWGYIGLFCGKCGSGLQIHRALLREKHDYASVELFLLIFKVLLQDI